jgi:hypothetical protein
LSLVLCILLAACVDDEETKTPPPPPELKLLGLRSALGPRAPLTNGCIELGPDTNQTVFVVLDVKDFDLKPPGACRGEEGCGAANVTFKGPESFTVLGVLETLPVSFAGRKLGAYRVTASLVDDYGENVGKDACRPGPCSLDGAIEVATDCGAPRVPEPETAPDSGAIPERPLDAGAPPDAGTKAETDGGLAPADAGTADAGDELVPADAAMGDAGDG